MNIRWIKTTFVISGLYDGCLGIILIAIADLVFLILFLNCRAALLKMSTPPGASVVYRK